MNYRIWPLLVQKRLLKKSVLLVMFLVLAGLTSLFVFTSSFKSGVFTVGLYLEDDDETALLLKDQLMESGVIKYRLCSSREEAVDLVKNNAASAAWIIRKDLTENIWNCGKKFSIKPVVSVIEGDSTPILAFTREILCSRLYEFFSYDVYAAYTRKNIPVQEVSDSEMRRIYDYYSKYNDIIEVHGTGSVRPLHILPFRGLLSAWLVLFGLIAALYSIWDEREGALCSLRPRQKKILSFIQSGVILFDAVLAMSICLLAAGFWTSFFKEAAYVLLLYVSVLLFSSLFKNIVRSYVAAGTLIPLIFIADIVFSPVIIKISSFRHVSWLFPSYWYLNSIASVSFLKGWLAYIAVLFAMNMLFYPYTKKGKNITMA